MANIFRRPRQGIKSSRSARLTKLDQELTRAMNELYDFRIQLTVYILMLERPTSSNPTLGIPPFKSDSQSISDIPRTFAPTAIRPTSIDDIWLCSHSSSLLVDAEERWRHDDPELAIELASRVIS
ncbi:hypothetical protein PEX1_003420 [Penicillium expansum]|uniref:Uncharacterized protein n=1 Tax=Penicillium expansum TaxID=27334 RepID=A0A0A2KKS6_PENEN|nr:hypothetical protein PEX2_032810 [Penicillium expansum]KGO41621.1 hypothetical protein PEXP_088450 [Penicillium expansum]KGO60142.1 hypothetical protein PEX2_032810 [Penicillium expansum]KGO67553.1 hypothetical protein PEX1_003420 [Penicillium expansum]